MATSRRRYQDHFCELRLSRLRAGYEDHCRGEACEHFAPAALLTLRRPLPTSAMATVEPAAGPASRPAVAPRLPSATVRPSIPLVTAVMPTRARPEFALQAVRYFLSQAMPTRNS